MTSSPPGLPVPGNLQRGNHRLRQEWIESGVFVVDVLCRTVERPDLAGVDVLDVGCGTKIVKTLLDNSLPIGRYVGVDVSAEVIDWLNENVSDPRFEFHHLDAHNDLYNPDGTPLAEFDRLPVGAERLRPHLPVLGVHPPGARRLRRHAPPAPPPRATRRTTRLLPLHERPRPPLSLSRCRSRPRWPATTLPSCSRPRPRSSKALAAKDRGFLDEIPEQPLLQARYDKDFALELIEGTGWEVISIAPPDRYIQHSMVCRPI